MIDAAAPTELGVNLILDNDGTQKTPLIHRWLARHPRFHLHFTPTSASWLNLVERWFALLTEKQIKRGVHQSTRALEAAILAFIALSNTTAKPFVWTKTADEILASVARFCHRSWELEASQEPVLADEVARDRGHNIVVLHDILTRANWSLCCRCSPKTRL